MITIIQFLQEQTEVAKKYRLKRIRQYQTYSETTKLITEVKLMEILSKFPDTINKYELLTELEK